MWFRSLFDTIKPLSTRAVARHPRRAAASRCLRLEPLEDRSLPSGYTFTDLGTLGGFTSYANDINSGGQVVGAATTAAGNEHAFVWNRGTMIDLGTFGGLTSNALAINDGGQVVGQAYTAEGHGRAFLVTPEDTDGNGAPDLWSRDTNSDGVNDLMLDLGSLGGEESIATDVNNLGQIVGVSSWHGFLWQDGSMTDLTSLGMDEYFHPGAINDAGQIAGDSPDGAFLWQNGASILVGGYFADLNARGQVLTNTYEARLWTPTTPNGTSGTLVPLPGIAPGGCSGMTQAYGLNNLGEVVGYANADCGCSEDGCGFYELSVLWSNGVVHDLNASAPVGHYLSQAEAINDAGQIVGVGDGQPAFSHAFLLTPSNEPDISISDATVTEGNSGTQAASLIVTLSAASSQPITISYSTANGSAAAGSDYFAASGTLTIPAGQTTGTITVPVLGDRRAEPYETFVVNLSSPTNATIADGQGVGTIVDDEPRISISDVTKKEGKKNQTTLFIFTVTLSAAYDQPVTMSFRTANGTAKTGDNDYVAKSGTLTFAPGETTKTITIQVKGDSKRESNEYFYLDLSGNSSNSLFTKNRGIGTILNDD